MKKEEINKIIDRNIKDIESKKGNFKEMPELQDKIMKGKISTLRRLKNDFKTQLKNEFKKVILEVQTNSNGQQRVTIPKKMNARYVEVKKHEA